MKDDRPIQFAPRDPETMAETGPQNHPLRGTVEFVEGFAFTAPRRAVVGYDEAMQNAQARVDAARARMEAAYARANPRELPPEPDAQLIVKRLRRKAEIMKLDAPRNSSLWYDLEEMLALVDLVGAQIGGSNA